MPFTYRVSPEWASLRSKSPIRGRTRVMGDQLTGGGHGAWRTARGLGRDGTATHDRSCRRVPGPSVAIRRKQVNVLLQHAVSREPRSRVRAGVPPHRLDPLPIREATEQRVAQVTGRAWG